MITHPSITIVSSFDPISIVSESIYTTSDYYCYHWHCIVVTVVEVIRKNLYKNGCLKMLSNHALVEGSTAYPPGYSRAGASPHAYTNGQRKATTMELLNLVQQQGLRLTHTARLNEYV